VLRDHVDSNVLDTLREVMEGEYAALLEVFIKDSEERVSHLNRLMLEPASSAAPSSQLEQLAMIAHSFKGSSSNMGATPLADLCCQLEDLARRHITLSDVRIRQLVLAIGEEYRAAREIFCVELRNARAD
jgi:chemotaxis protein histidine kinase CheA